MEADGDHDDDQIAQWGGDGNDQLLIRGLGGHYTLTADPGPGDDRGFMDAGDGNDEITYVVGPGEDVAFIDGGSGTDRISIQNSRGCPFTMVCVTGKVLSQSGTGGTLIIVKDMEFFAGCPVCCGDPVVLENITITGADCHCSAATSITIGPGVTVKTGANVSFKGPTVNLLTGFHAEEGAVVHIEQE